MQSNREANFLEGVNLKHQRFDLVVSYDPLKVLRTDISFINITLAHPDQKLDEVIHDLDPAMGPRGFQ
jgi:predicted nucleic acid-binding protein